MIACKRIGAFIVVSAALCILSSGTALANERVDGSASGDGVGSSEKAAKDMAKQMAEVNYILETWGLRDVKRGKVSYTCGEIDGIYYATCTIEFTYQICERPAPKPLPRPNPIPR